MQKNESIKNSRSDDNKIPFEKKVAIIGAGLSGLISGKEILAKGLCPIIFEKKADIGGLWNKDQGAMWDSMKTNLSKFCCSFSDFNHVPDEEDFPNYQSIFSYLKNYAEHFGVTQFIKFKTEVEKIQRVSSPLQNELAYSISYVEKGVRKTDVFKYLIIASGFYSKINFPKIPGVFKANNDNLNTYIIHSSQYRNSNNYKNKKVTIVGFSFSAIEIACDIAKNKDVDRINMVFSRSHWIIPKHLNLYENKQLPFDLFFYRREKRVTNDTPWPFLISLLNKLNKYIINNYSSNLIKI
jgi:dimethylaniline monooxygenase (N-oxide forming)